MKWIFQSLYMVMFLLGLVGCIAEDYDGDPPKAYLINSSTDVRLKEANVNWKKSHTERVKKETKGINVLAKKQKPIHIKSNRDILLNFQENGGEFTGESVRATLRQGTKSINLKYKDATLHIPNSKGTYTLDLKLNTDQGSVQYVGHVILE